MAKNDRDEKPVVGDESAERDAQKRKRSSLRSIEADLKVIVGRKDADEDNDKRGEDKENKESTYEVFWEFSQSLAAQSEYVNTFLATSLHTSNDSAPHKDHNEIVFEDITPSQWKLMMRFINNPLAFTEMEVHEAVDVAPLFDKYEFANGVKLCDEVLFKKVDFEVHIDIKNLDQMEDLTQIALLAHNFNLKKTSYMGRNWLRELLYDSIEGKSVTKFPLTKTQISLLVPVILHDNELQDMFDVLGLGEFGDFDDDDVAEHFDKGGAEFSLGLENIVRMYFDDADHIDLTNPMFPSLLLARIGQISATSLCQLHVKSIRVRFAEEREWHEYHFDFNGNYAGGVRNVIRCPITKNWQLLVNDGQLLSTCKNSRFLPVPPPRGWDKKVVVQYRH